MKRAQTVNEAIGLISRHYHCAVDERGKLRESYGCRAAEKIATNDFELNEIIGECRHYQNMIPLLLFVGSIRDLVEEADQ